MSEESKPDNEGLTEHQISDKRSRFIAEYLIDLNATQAAIRAGYTPQGASHRASLLLDDPEIKKAINKQLESRQKRTLITADRVLAEIYELAMTDVEAIFNEDGSIKPIREIPEPLRRAIAGIEVDEIWEWEENEGGRRHKVQVGVTKKIKLWDKNKALENLAKHLKLLDTNIKLQGIIGSADDKTFRDEFFGLGKKQQDGNANV